MYQFQEIHYNELRGLCLPPGILKKLTSLYFIVRVYRIVNNIYRPTSS